MSNRFQGPQGEGAKRRLRETKRAEAEDRQARVLPERTRVFRMTGNPPRAKLPFRMQPGGAL